MALDGHRMVHHPDVPTICRAVCSSSSFAAVCAGLSAASTPATKSNATRNASLCFCVYCGSFPLIWCALWVRCRRAVVQEILHDPPLGKADQGTSSC